LADLLAYASGIAVDQAWYLVSKANPPLDQVWSQGVASSRLERFINCPATINCQWQEN
jgi:hypothetical protein